MNLFISINEKNQDKEKETCKGVAVPRFRDMVKNSNLCKKLSRKDALATGMEEYN